MSMSCTHGLEPQAFTPVSGETYRLRSGGEYRCMGFQDGDPVFMNTESCWVMTVHGLKRYPSGLVEWDYSTGGHWQPEVYTWMP